MKENIEQFNYLINEITADNLQLLIAIRKEVDGIKDINKLEQEAESYANSSNKKAFVMQDGDRAIGYVEVKLLENELPKGSPELDIILEYAHLARIGRSNDYGGGDLGGILLRFAEDWAKREGKEGMWLDFLVNNYPAVRLYKENSYVNVAEFKDGNIDRLRRIAVKIF